jgi:hypothetical protein
MRAVSPHEEAARQRAVATAADWTRRQAQRLGVTEETVLLALRKGLFAEDIEHMSAAAFVAETGGRKLAPQDIFTIRALRKAREFWRPDRGDAF